MANNHPKVKIYYLGQDAKTSNVLIVKCINEILSVKFKDYIYYTHNLGGFFIIFIFSALRQVNLDKGFNTTDKY